jgi:glycerol transport system ATP-binding protein
MALELKNLAKRVGAETYIHETSLVLADQGFNILLGTTLSGKTTLMKLLAGIDKPTAGKIWFPPARAFPRVQTASAARP